MSLPAPTHPSIFVDNGAILRLFEETSLAVLLSSNLPKAGLVRDKFSINFILLAGDIFCHFPSVLSPSSSNPVSSDQWLIT